jgi:hypothetical protein
MRLRSGRDNKRLFVAFLFPAVVLVGLVLGGTYFSKERFVSIANQQAEEVLNQNSIRQVAADERKLCYG